MCYEDSVWVVGLFWRAADALAVGCETGVRG